MEYEGNGEYCLRKFGNWYGITFNGMCFGFRPDTGECYALPDDRCPIITYPRGEEPK